MSFLSKNIKTNLKTQKEKKLLKEYNISRTNPNSNFYKFVQTEVYFENTQKAFYNPVVFANFGQIPSEELLVEVPTINEKPNQTKERLHIIAASRFNRMRQESLSSGYDFRIETGYRTGNLIKNKNTHKTGLIFNLGFPEPIKKDWSNVSSIEASEPYRWLFQNSWRFGIGYTPGEPWCFQVLIPRGDWITGIDSFPYSHSGKLVERRLDNNKTTINPNFLLDDI
jgi:hypothetical protein